MDVVIDLKRLDRLIRSFYLITKYRIAFYDTSFRKIISYPKEECAYCVAIHKQPNGQEKCQLSDEMAFQHCLSSNDLYCYACHAGLTEAAISLKYEGVTVGHIMFGQISTEKDQKKRFDALISKLDGLPSSLEEKAKIIADITYQDEEQIQAASTVLLAIGKYALSEELFSFRKDDFVEKVDTFIAANIGEKITSSDVAASLSISRTALYSLSKSFLKTGIGAYIQNKRLEKTRYLLLATSLKIQEVASEVGFSDYNYFERVFRKKTGMTASSFRRGASLEKLNV
jgi:AraC-like DNA-binding protein